MATESVHLLIEPFNSGSHKQLIDILLKNIPGTYAVTFPGKKWHWKARTSALLLSQRIPRNSTYRSLFASSVLSLAELVALRPDLARLHKVLYFHENQLIYPVRREVEHDFQFGYNQILSCLVADVVLFNSEYNRESFLTSIRSFLKLIPYERPTDVAEQLRPKCHVLHFPMQYPMLTGTSSGHTTDTENRSGHTIETDNRSGHTTETGIVMDTSENQDLGEEATDEQKNKSQNFKDNHNSTGKSGLLDICNHTESNRERSSTSQSDSYGSVKTENHDTAIENCNINTQQENTPIVSICDMCSEDKSVTNDGSVSMSRATVGRHVEINEAISSSTCEHQPCGDTGNDTSDSKRARYDDKGAGDISRPFHIVWPHRWEHDKGPEAFFKVMIQLHESGVKFTLSVLGENFVEIPDVFEEAKLKLQDRIVHWGYLDSKQEYFNVLHQADCVVSTANHEFFGVAMLEAVHLGCYPLCPNRLVYPEIFTKEYLYNTDNQLFKKLREFCKKPHLVRNHECKIDTKKYSWDILKDSFIQHITAKDGESESEEFKGEKSCINK